MKLIQWCSTKYNNRSTHLTQHPYFIQEIPMKISPLLPWQRKEKKKIIIHKNIIHKLKVIHIYIVQQYQPKTLTTTKQTPKTPSMMIPMNQFFPEEKKKKKKTKPISHPLLPLPPFLPLGTRGRNGGEKRESMKRIYDTGSHEVEFLRGGSQKQERLGRRRRWGRKWRRRNQGWEPERRQRGLVARLRRPASS